MLGSFLSTLQWFPTLDSALRRRRQREEKSKEASHENQDTDLCFFLVLGLNIPAGGDIEIHGVSQCSRGDRGCLQAVCSFSCVTANFKVQVSLHW